MDQPKPLSDGGGTKNTYIIASLIYWHFFVFLGMSIMYYELWGTKDSRNGVRKQFGYRNAPASKNVSEWVCVCVCVCVHVCVGPLSFLWSLSGVWWINIYFMSSCSMSVPSQEAPNSSSTWIQGRETDNPSGRIDSFFFDIIFKPSYYIYMYDSICSFYGGYINARGLKFVKSPFKLPQPQWAS